MLNRPRKDIVEIFGYSPDDTTRQCRTLWNIGACPFINKTCSKTNHDKSITYGTCSVTSPFGDCIICPNRLYADNYNSLKEVSKDAFGENIPFFTFDDFIKNRENISKCIVALGMNSGKEIKVGNSLSMDWVLAKILNGTLNEYTGIEVQSIDITGNYRDTWYAYKNIKTAKTIPTSAHGMNWANVHKRLIPQLIRKGQVYSRSALVKTGIYFILPNIVYRKFEEIIGKDIPLLTNKRADNITVHTYALSDQVLHGQQRGLKIERKIRFSLDDFSKRFISGPNLPSGGELDQAIRCTLGVK
ncbi:MAG: restriction endonuclease [Deltaproteobacteria bacterium]|nr:restriction endonuclease [Deltaproteobacteria bacterium]